jgi:hypothetical protein
MTEVCSDFVYGPDCAAEPDGGIRTVFGPEEMPPLKDRFKHPTAELPVEGGVCEEARASARRTFEEPAGGWIRMPVRAPVTDLEFCASAQNDSETSDAKFTSSELTRIGESGVGSDAGPICYAGCAGAERPKLRCPTEPCFNETNQLRTSGSIARQP